MDEIKIAERLTAVEQSVKSAHHRLDNIEKLTESVYALANETKTMREDMNKLQTDVDGIKAMPKYSDNHHYWCGYRVFYFKIFIIGGVRNEKMGKSGSRKSRKDGGTNGCCNNRNVCRYG